MTIADSDEAQELQRRYSRGPSDIVSAAIAEAAREARKEQGNA